MKTWVTNTFLFITRSKTSADKSLSNGLFRRIKLSTMGYAVLDSFGKHLE